LGVFFKKIKVASCLDEVNCNVYEITVFNDISKVYSVSRTCARLSNMHTYIYTYMTYMRTIDKFAHMRERYRDNPQICQSLWNYNFITL